MSHENPQDKAVELLSSLLDRAADGFVCEGSFQTAADLKIEAGMLVEYIVQASVQRLMRSRKDQ
jgi:hypothetical protein